MSKKVAPTAAATISQVVRRKWVLYWNMDEEKPQMFGIYGGPEGPTKWKSHN